jgi:hypothetical protein
MLPASSSNLSMVDVSQSVCSPLMIHLISGDCEEVRKVYEVLGRFVTYRRPGSFLVDTFPTLADNTIFNLFSNWKQVGAEIHKKDSEVFLYFWKQMLEEVRAGTAPHSFGREFVQSNYEALGLDELDAAYTVYKPRLSTLANG